MVTIIIITLNVFIVSYINLHLKMPSLYEVHKKSFSFNSYTMQLFFLCTCGLMNENPCRAFENVGVQFVGKS